jgi:hypothetical protein
MCMTVGHSRPGEGSFIACDTGISFIRGGVFLRRVDVGGRLQSTGSGWCTAAGDTYRPCHIALAALRDAGAIPSGANPVERAAQIVTAALSAAGLDAHPVGGREGAFILVIEPGADLVCLDNGAAGNTQYAASFPVEFTDDEGEKRSRALCLDIASAGPSIEARIRAVAKHFAEINRDVQTVSPIMECGFLIPTPFGPMRGFLRGNSQEIADTNARDIFDRFRAAPTTRLPLEQLQLHVLSTNAAGLATGFRVKPDLGVKNAGGSTFFGINRHNDEKLAISTDTKTFGVSFDNIPQIRALPQSILLLGVAAGVDRTIEFKATGVSVSGYTARAVASTGSSSIAESETWATTLNGTPAATQTLANQSAAAYCDLAHANGVLTTYTANYDVDTSAMLSSNTLTVSLYKNNGVASTSWTLVASKNYGSGIVTTGEVLSFAAAMTLDWDVQLVITYQNAPAVGQKASVVVHTVTYSQITAGTEVSLTPNVGNQILFQAMEAP